MINPSNQLKRIESKLEKVASSLDAILKSMARINDEEKPSEEDAA
jgi:hypothetical protein